MLCGFYVGVVRCVFCGCFVCVCVRGMWVVGVVCVLYVVCVCFVFLWLLLYFQIPCSHVKVPLELKLMATAHGLVGWTVGPLLIHLGPKEPFPGFTFVLTTRVRDHLDGVIMDLPATSTRLLYSSMIPTEKFRGSVLARQNWARVLAGVEERTISLLAEFAAAETRYIEQEAGRPNGGSGGRFRGIVGLDMYADGNRVELFGGLLSDLLLQRVVVLEEEASRLKSWRSMVGEYARLDRGGVRAPASSGDERVSDDPYVCSLFDGCDGPCDCGHVDCGCHCGVCVPDRERESILRDARLVDAEEKERGGRVPAMGQGDWPRSGEDPGPGEGGSLPAFDSEVRSTGSSPTGSPPSGGIVRGHILPGFQNTGSSCWLNAFLQGLLLMPVFSGRVLALRGLVSVAVDAGTVPRRDRTWVLLDRVASVVSKVDERRVVDAEGVVRWNAAAPIQLLDLSDYLARRFGEDVRRQLDASEMCNTLLTSLLGEVEAMVEPQMSSADARVILHAAWRNDACGVELRGGGPNLATAAVDHAVLDWIERSSLRSAVTFVILGLDRCDVCLQLVSTPATHDIILRAFIPDGGAPPGGFDLAGLIHATMVYERESSGGVNSCCHAPVIKVERRFVRVGDWLLVQMSRARRGAGQSRSVKIRDRVCVPAELPPDPAIGLLFTYHLSSFIVHHGQVATRGHYVCFGRLTGPRHGAANANRWVCFDDSQVCFVDFESESVQDMLCHDGVMFFYKRGLAG